MDAHLRYPYLPTKEGLAGLAAAAMRPMNERDYLLSVFYAYNLWKKTADIDLDRRRRMANDADFRRTLADSRDANLAAARQVGEILRNMDRDTARAVLAHLQRPSHRDLVVCVAIALPAGHPWENGVRRPRQAGRSQRRGAAAPALRLPR